MPSRFHFPARLVRARFRRLSLGERKRGPNRRRPAGAVGGIQSRRRVPANLLGSSRASRFAPADSVGIRGGWHRSGRSDPPVETQAASVGQPHRGAGLGGATARGSRRRFLEGRRGNLAMARDARAGRGRGRGGTAGEHRGRALWRRRRRYGDGATRAARPARQAPWGPRRFPPRLAALALAGLGGRPAGVLRTPSRSARAAAQCQSADQAARRGDIAKARSAWLALWRVHGGDPGLAARLAWAHDQAGEVGRAALWVLRGELVEARDPSLRWVEERVREAGGLIGAAAPRAGRSGRSNGAWGRSPSG